MTVPIWLLDVDGVINALRPNNEWPSYTSFKANGFRITFAPDLLNRIAGLHHRGQVEVQWLTTWMTDADILLAKTFGLPTGLACAAKPAEFMARHTDFDWWKFPVAKRVQAETGRRVIWTDDDLSYDKDAWKWVADTDEVLGVCPDSATGLLPVRLERIEKWL